MRLNIFLVLVALVMLSACGGGSGSSPSSVSGASQSSEDPVDKLLFLPILNIPNADFLQPDATIADIISAYGLSGDPADGALPIQPSQNNLVRLGQLLFFSKALSLNYDVACATCHHPKLGSGDGLSLPVGVASAVQHILGPGRSIDPLLDVGPQADGGPNVPRNSQPIFNAVLYKKVMFWDGRIEVLPDAILPVGSDIAIRTPDSGNNPDPQAGESLLEAQARFPVTGPDEMRGYGHADLITNGAIRERIERRFQGLADGWRMTAPDVSRWIKRFREAFNDDSSSAAELLTFANMQKALAAYQASQIFINSPWKRYVSGNSGALSVQAKQGAMLFNLSPEQGGLGCVACHSGDHFTSERFYNVGFPQFGHGIRADRRDLGRYDVSRRELDRFAFRVPSLINVSATAPWGHTGGFDNMEELLLYHANPVVEFGAFDSALTNLMQFINIFVEYDFTRTYTEEALSATSLAMEALPGRELTSEEVGALMAFMQSLTDDKVLELVENGFCASAVGCPSLWTLQGYETDADGENYADGNTLYFGTKSLYDSVTPPSDNTSYPAEFSLAFPDLPPRTGFAELESCSDLPSAKTNEMRAGFVERAASAGLTERHGYDLATWLADDGIWFETLMVSGGLSGAYVDADCWPDLIFSGGDTSGLVVYRNEQGLSFTRDYRIPAGAGREVSGVALVDLNGDYRREWVGGNTRNGNISIISWDDNGVFSEVASLPMTRNTFGIAFGDYDQDGFPDMFASHWGITGLPGSAPGFWRNNNGEVLIPSDGYARLSVSDGVNQNFNFSSAFADFNRDGWQDLAVASDFSTSLITTNVRDSLDANKRVLENVTDRGIITDENGMGHAVGDIDNDGDLDWFVTSIQDPNGFSGWAWGVTGNRLYENISIPWIGNVRFMDVTGSAGVRDGLWGWGACMADFNNDGWLDIFHENGFGYIPEDVRNDSTAFRIDNYKNIASEFITTKPRMFINQGDGTFVDQSDAWGLQPSNGRGVVCIDYDRDGDVDIALSDSSETPKLYENQMGSGAQSRFVSVRLEGLPPNTDALGARVLVTADLNGNGFIGFGEVQTRTVTANSNYVSQNTVDLHFGLGEADIITNVTVVWPNDEVAFTCGNLPVNRHMIFRQSDLQCSIFE